MVDKPIIQYGVEEALASGAENIIVVTGRGKAAIEDHFDVSFELEHTLESRGKQDELNHVRRISDLIQVSYTRQKEALGLGHAVSVTKELVGDEPFAVILPDDVIHSETPCLKQLLDVYEKRGGRGHRCDEGAAGPHFGLRRCGRNTNGVQRLNRPAV